MKPIYSLFFNGFAWNTLESLIYQGILITHFMVLYHYMDATLFGLMGVLFSSLYLITFLANAGFDTALAPHARLLSTNVHFWNQILIPHALVQLILYICIGIGGLVINAYLPVTIQLPFTITLTLALLLITESTKKTVRTCAHLTFNNKIAALIELGGVGGYVITVWLLYIYYTRLSLAMLFIPLLISSTMSCLMLGYLLSAMYRVLPSGALSDLPTQRSFLITRFYTYGANLGHILFSSNFLVPLCAFHIGLVHAGVFKLISSITHSMRSILHAMFGPTSQALFSHMRDTPHHEQQHLFFTITEQLHHILYGAIIFFIINYSKIIDTTAIPLYSSTSILMVIFFIIQCTEQLFIIYEKFFIAHNRTAYVCFLSLLSLALCSLLLLVPISLSPTIIMSLVLIFRICTLGIMGICAYYLFNIRPAVTCRIDYLLYACISALIFFICF